MLKLTFICLLVSCAVAAQDTAALHTLQTVTIFSAKSNSVTPVQTLNGVALERMNSLSVADATRYFSGVQLKDYGGLGGLKTLNVHSMGSNHLGVFYDGIQLSNAQNGTVDLGRFSLDNIEQIDLYNAQKGVIFQPAKGFSSTASLYLQSRKPVFKADEQTHGKVSFKTGSFRLINPAVRLEQKLSDKVTAVASSEWTHGNGRYKFRYTNGTYDTTAIRNNSEIDAWRIEGGLYGQLKDSSTWNIKTYYYNSSRGLPGAIVNNVFQRSQHQWDRNFFVQSSFNKKIGNRYNMLLNAKYGHDYVRYRDPEIVTIDGILMNRFRQHEYYISSANQYKLTSFWDVVLSGDFQVNEMTAVNLDHFPIPTRYTTLAALASQLHFKRLDLQGSLLATIVNEDTKLYVAGKNYRAYTPTVIASWQPFTNPAFRVRSFYKNIFRMPTFNDLYYGTSGSPALKPEYTKQYDAGFSYTQQMPGLWEYLSIQVDGYYNNVTDKIIAAPGKSFRWMMQNIGKVDIYGLDAGIQTALHRIASVQTDFSLKYTYQRAMDMTTPGEVNYKDQIAYIPLHSGSFITHASWKNYDINYSFIYVGKRNSTGYEIPENYLKPWYTSDISLLTHFNYRKTLVKVSCEVNNLLNQYYDVVINYPMPGRYFRFSVSLNY
ncbi:Outer membrane cobalamin receptor protein [Chitinophaga sp. CF118]|uniref:TonB-dependent receptor plug domain-containing protein n=1 Tax=Chitinophaga sp. CF118 TaxID=1884367 RepID=UPI0008EA4945|nr:TonB-dependent receptor [Chitinophaga sp. CF118]SFE51438.1 Outer membrane cobalamin receptor protein [Chitinophaga sp. CF118]